MASRRTSRALYFLTVLAAPVALVVETGLRAVLFPPEFEEVRAWLASPLTAAAWVLGGAAALAGVAGAMLQTRLVGRRLAALGPDASEDARESAVTGVFLLTASVPQVPALLATFAFMFGAELTPVLAGIAVCSAGVVAQALRAPGLTGGSRDA